jgi:hypothetical protein
MGTGAAEAEVTLTSGFATSVGTTALAMTAATSAEYWDWSMMPLVKPKRAEIVPKVRPVDISNVVYMASVFREPKERAIG